MISKFMHLTEILSQLEKKIRKGKNDGMRDMGLKSSHTSILYLLAKNKDGMTPSQLSEASFSDAGFLSRTMKELRQLGLVQRHEDDGKYNARYVLTPQGMAVGKEIVSRIDRAEAIAKEGISQEDIAAFYRVAERLIQNLENLPKEWRQIRES